MIDASLHSLKAVLLEGMRHYHGAALWIERNGPASDKLLHMNAGLILWLATVLLRGRRWGDPRNLLPLMLLEALNETADWLFPTKWTLSGTIADIFWTLFWPILLTALIGGQPARKRGRR
ncbi:hypothetical protein Q4F19_16310 [Sphingomonas sp. BIUV-7]|uniref:VanZ-like domain-containing protein n=1 Tax=Sphingomonas natans TaxID=3063330 RepID=A0ABT8YCA5_9SPHN|nr:hypothetical protein [Sphingomonas sp. BIUV-7]MDO6415954.1 hypothetical protein [Sphingomonas sp. BIUV-7]